MCQRLALDEKANVEQVIQPRANVSATRAHSRELIVRAAIAGERGRISPARDGELNAAAADWTIREVEATASPGSRGNRCLVFESEALVRRVWSYPANWPTLNAPALLLLASLA
jgi:hypothetical protein